MLTVLLAAGLSACAGADRPTLGAPPTAAAGRESALLHAELRQRIVAGLSTVHTVRAEIVEITSSSRTGPVERRSEVIETDLGDFVEIVPGGGGYAYLAAQQQHWSWTATGDSIGTTTGVAPGPPDFGYRPGPQAPANLARLALSIEDPAIREARHHDRPAWIVQGPVVAFGGDNVAITVDQVTGLGVRVQATARAVPVYELNVERLTTGQPVSEADLQGMLPKGEPSHSQAMGFRRVSLETVAAAVGYRPLLPASLPPGYAPADLAVAALVGRSRGESLTPDREVVSAIYRRGLDRIAVSNRRVDTGLGIFPLGRTSDRVSGGALDGSDSYIVRGQGPPGTEWTLRAFVGGRAVIVVGPDRDGVIAVARTLAPAG